MDENTMDLVRQLTEALQENMQLRERLRVLENTVKEAEVEDALFRRDNKDSDYIPVAYRAEIPAETINKIMGWKRASLATAIIEELKEERNGESD